MPLLSLISSNGFPHFFGVKASHDSGFQDPYSLPFFLLGFMSYHSSSPLLASALHLTFIRLECFALFTGIHMTNSPCFFCFLLKYYLSSEAIMAALFEIAIPSLLPLL